MTIRNDHQPNDENLQTQADTTWEDLESGDRLGQAIKDSMESRLPESNPELRQMLASRLKESEISETESGTESRLPVNKLENNSRNWTFRMIAVAVSMGAVVFVGLVMVDNNQKTTWLSEPSIQSNFDDDAADDKSTPSVVEGLEDFEQNLPHQQQLAQQQFSDSNKRLEAWGDPNGADGPPSSSSPSSVTPPVAKYSEGGDSSRDKSKGWHFGTEWNESGQQSGHQQANFVPSAPDVRFVIPNEQLGEDVFSFYLGVDRSTSPVPHESGEAIDWELRVDDEYDRQGSSGEQYDAIYENRFLPTRGKLALSTFSIDVDTASYANMRRFLTNGQQPPPNAIRIEELINYFNYDYPQPEGETPFSVNMEVAACPWNSSHQLLRIGLKGKEVHREERPVSNLVFLLDVSGSMSSEDKLPLLKRGLRMMVDRLQENDRVSIVTYAGNAGLVLEPTSGDQKGKIHAAIDNLNSGGSTNGSAGIQLAYDLASQNFIEGGVNRVIWATDGDLNVGITGDQQLVSLVSGRAEEGVFLTVLGFGTGNLKDSKLEKIADNGNGMYAYIDGMREARKVLVEQMSGSLVTIAKDVKLQIEFNPGEVAAYRLIGYENRVLAAEDFDNDAKDAGEIGAGHTVTALYELVPADGKGSVDAETQNLKYQTAAQEDQPRTDEGAGLTEQAGSGELLTLALRYKLPESTESSRIEFALKDSKRHFEEASGDFRFAASVASFGMLLRGSKHRGDSTVVQVEEWASGALGTDNNGYRAEFLDLVRRVR